MKWLAASTTAAALVSLGLLPSCSTDGSAPDPGAGKSAPPADRPEAPVSAVDPMAGMVPIPGGTIEVEGGSVTVEPFLMDAHEVTNDEFSAFVEATGYVTEAEQLGNSVVFIEARGAEGIEPHEVVEGAWWRAPRGPGSTLDGLGDHPVVHVSWNDAVAYARWRGCRLPTREEWIFAARGGLDDPLYPWGDTLRPDGAHQMNAWQGVFPVEDHGLDGYRGTAPVGSFAPNGYGLHDMAGNVWEWNSHREQAGPGPNDQVAEVRGGSFLCRERASDGFHACRGYRLEAAQWKTLFDGNHNVGFRCAHDGAPR